MIWVECHRHREPPTQHSDTHQSPVTSQAGEPGSRSEPGIQADKKGNGADITWSKVQQRVEPGDTGAGGAAGQEKLVRCGWSAGSSREGGRTLIRLTPSLSGQYQAGLLGIPGASPVCPTQINPHQRFRLNCKKDPLWLHINQPSFCQILLA